MTLNIVLISKLCTDIIDIRTVDIDRTNLLTPLKDLENVLYDNYGLHNEFTIFWRYSSDQFFEITDYLSFTTALTFGAENRIYVLLKDYTDPWWDNGIYIKVLNYLEDKAIRLEHADPYDVKIIRPESRDSAVIDAEMLAKSQVVSGSRTDCDVMTYATRLLTASTYYTADFAVQAMLMKALKQVITASFLCLANILGMKGEIISCPHKDIYFLETNTKSESTDLANMFASPASGRGHTIKCKPRTKLKQKYNPALDFFVENKATTKTAGGHGAKEDVTKCGSSVNQSERTGTGGGGNGGGGGVGGGGSRRNSIDLYEEAATILGLTCSQTDDCKCIECQCHYFDFEEEMDFAPMTSSTTLGTAGGGEYYVDHNSSCSIQ